MVWWFQLLSVLCCIGAVVRFIQIRLFRNYPVFVAYFLIPLIIQTVAVVYGISSRQICTAYPLLEPVRNIGYVVVMWELVSATFRNCADLHRLGRWPVVVAFIAAAGLVLSFAVLQGSYLYHGVILSIIIVERGIALSLGVFTVGLLWLVSRYGVNLPRNSAVLLLFWSIWFLGDAAMLAAASLLPQGFSFVVNDGLAILEIASCLGWALLLSEADETSHARVCIPEV